MIEKVIKNELENKIPSGIIFDFNGVMVDDFPLQQEAWSKISMELRGQPVTYEEMVQKIRGVPSKETIKWLSGGLSEQQIEEMARKKDEIISDLFQNSDLFHLNLGLENFLNQLKERNIPRTIATSSRPEIFKFSFTKLGLDRWFDFKTVLFNDGTYPGKPAPDAYVLAAKKINMNPEACIVVEDALSGIQSAHKAGVKNIIVIGTEDRVKAFISLPGVVKGISNFEELNVDELFGKR